MVGRAPEITRPPAEHLRDPGLAVAQHESERPEPGDPMIRVVQVELRAQAGHLPLRCEFCQSELDQSLHLLREQHAALLKGRRTRGTASRVPRPPAERTRARNPWVGPAST